MGKSAQARFRRLVKGASSCASCRLGELCVQCREETKITELGGAWRMAVMLLVVVMLLALM